MTGINHMLTGTVIAIVVKQPLLAVPLAFLSHFLLDATPHFGNMPFYEFGHKYFAAVMAADGVIAVAAVATVMFLLPQLAAVIAACAFAAILPDILLLHYYTHGRPDFWFYKFHLGIQWFERPQGAIVEASYLIFIGTTAIALIWRG